jgi:predicted phosphohydrolase
MSLYAIGDLHLSLETNKPMDAFGGKWENYIEKIETGFSHLSDTDVCVICGDITWGMTIEECLADFQFIDKLPGKKIILKGNHDYWWTTATKAMKFFEKNGITTIAILNNNCYFYENTAICGTRGWFYEETVHGAHDKKIMNREVQRLRTSLEAAGDVEERICFFHYPPRFNNYVCHTLIQTMVDFGVKQCFYGHIHSYGHKLAVQGVVEGIEYSMVSADYVDFTPVKIR